MNWPKIKKMYGAHGILCLALAASVCSAQLPPDPNNAALLYYQAFLHCPDRGSEISNELAGAAYGDNEPNEAIREYLRRCQRAIRYAERASQISNCDWGLWNSLGLSQALPQLASVRLLGQILHVDARVLAGDGDYRGAFERCMTLERLARHTGDGGTTLFFLLAVAIEDEAQRGICQILGSMPSDAETLDWLSDQLAAVPSVSLSSPRPLEMGLELACQSARANGEALAAVRIQLGEAVARNEIAIRVQDLSNADLIDYMRNPYKQFLKSALPIMDDNRPYEKIYAEILKLIADLDQQMKMDPIGRVVVPDITILADEVLRLYDGRVRATAHRNAFSIALALYREKAKAGRLPSELPGGLPKDPYTNENFLYSVTDEGFSLRSPIKPKTGGRAYLLECTVPGEAH